MKIYLIRHGETLSNQEKRYMGWTDVPLSKEGIAKLQEALAKNYYPDYNGQFLYTSELVRTKQTMELLYGEMPYISDERLNESNFGDFENKTYEELKENPDYISWITGDHLANRCPNGESFWDMKKRVVKAFGDIINRHKYSGQDIIIVLHSGSIVALMETLHPNLQKTYYEWRLENGEYYLLDYEEPEEIMRILRNFEN